MSSHQGSCANPGWLLLAEQAGEHRAAFLAWSSGWSCNDSASQHPHFQLLYFSTTFHHLEKCLREGCAAGRAGVGLAAKPPRWSEANATSLPFIPSVHVLTLSTRSVSVVRLGAVEHVHAAVNRLVCYSPQCLWDDFALSHRTETSQRDWNTDELGPTSVMPVPGCCHPLAAK